MGDPDAPPLQAGELLQFLDRHGVRYVVVGGLAATVHGATRVTFDIDLVPEWTDDNLGRLAAALREAGARLVAPEAPTPISFPIDARSLRQFEVSTWRSTLGDLDVIIGTPTATRGVLARYAAPAAVLVAPVPATPAVPSLLAIARRHPTDALRIVVGGSLPLRPDYLFHELPTADAARLSERCHGESAVVQYQLLLHRPAGRPLGEPPVLVLATPDDRLVPIRGIRATGQRYGATLVEFPGMGHDLMLDARWREPFDALLSWVASAVPAP